MSQPPARRTKTTVFVFGLIGVFNTAFDIVLYLVFLKWSGSILIANLVATSAALVGSYLLNSKFTFRADGWTTRSFIGFVAVTVFGLWVLQTAAIYGLTHVLSGVPEHIWRNFGSHEATVRALVPKLLATVVTFLWNYLWYSRVIFKRQRHDVQVIRSLE